LGWLKERMMQWIVVLGMVAGMRTMTPIAVLCWFTWLGLFRTTALGEYVADVLPRTPSRTEPALVAGRLVCAVLAGVLGWHGIGEPVVGGVVLALIGVPIGIYGWHWVRVNAARRLGRDWPVGLAESALALGMTLYAVDSLHWALLRPAVAWLHGVSCALAG
jgi:uncharacterized membrane protein